MTDEQLEDMLTSNGWRKSTHSVTGADTFFPSNEYLVVLAKRGLPLQAAVKVQEIIEPIVLDEDGR